MKILESYLAIAESLFIEDVIAEAETMKLKPKGGGKTVTFTDKDNYEKAQKSGDYEEPEDGEEEPKGKGLGKGDFERDFDDGEPEDKPHGGDTGKDADFKGEPKPGDDDFLPPGEEEPDSDYGFKDDEEPKEKQQYTDADGNFDKDAADNAIGPSSQWGANYNPFTKSLNDKEFDRYTKSREDGMSHTDAFRVAEHPSEEEQHKQFNKEIDALVSQAKQMKDEDPLTAKELLKTAGELKRKRDDLSGIWVKKKESITIDGKQYRPIKESKQHIFKEIYDRTFRSLK